jgi:hypothetical protein
MWPLLQDKNSHRNLNLRLIYAESCFVFLWKVINTISARVCPMIYCIKIQNYNTLWLILRAWRRAFWSRYITVVLPRFCWAWCAYNVTLMRVQKFLPRKSSKYCIFVRARARVCGRGGTGAAECLLVGSLTNPACNASPYCHLQLLYLNHNFRHYFTNGTIFRKTLLNIKCVFLFFFYSFNWNISHSKKN